MTSDNNPSKNLYHYCTVETFLAIISNRTIRLSSMSMANDSMEGKLLAKLLRTYATKDDLSPHHLAEFDNAIERAMITTDGYGFCMSEEDDLLSQWRGYANDGAGVAIGFTKKYLDTWAEASRQGVSNGDDECGFDLVKIKYDEAEQQPVLKDWYNYLKTGIVSAPSFSTPTLSHEQDIELAELMQRKQATIHALSYFNMTLAFTMKSNAFREENEWRLLAREGFYGAVDFQANGSKLVPFISAPFLKNDEEPLTEIILGPKCTVPEQIVTQCLERYGYKGVGVRRSEASYR